MLPRKQCTPARLEAGARALSYPQLHFLQTAMTDFPTLSYTSTTEFCSLSYTRSLKKVSHSGGASMYRPLSGVTQGFPCQGKSYLLQFEPTVGLAKFHACTKRDPFSNSQLGIHKPFSKSWQKDWQPMKLTFAYFSAASAISFGTHWCLPFVTAKSCL